MKIFWLGESGFVLDDGHARIIIDPYLSDAMGAQNPENRRRIPLDESFLRKRYDLLLFTHAHADHADPETVAALLSANPDLVLCGPPSVLEKLRGQVGSALFVELSAGNRLQRGAFMLQAVMAVHSDPGALGFLVNYENNTIYFSGDTAFLCGLERHIPEGVDAAFVCVNGGIGRNMEPGDALRLARRIKPKRLFPAHFGVLRDDQCAQTFLRLARAEGFVCDMPQAFAEACAFPRQ